MSTTAEELRRAFEAAISAEEKLKVLEKMEESGFEAKDLVSAHEQLAKQYHSEGKFPEKVVYYAKKALDVYLELEKSNGCKIRRLSIAYTLYLLGAVCRELKSYDDSLRYLNWSEKNIVALQEEEVEEDNSGFDGEVLSVLDVTEFELVEVKKAMGKIEEVPVHMRKILEVKLKTLEEGCLELGKAYKNAYVAYMSVMNTEEARPLCEKALEIYEKHFGGDSVEVAEIRVHLAALYGKSHDFENSLQQSQLAQSVFKNMGMTNELLEIQVQESQVLIALGRAEEAVEALTVAIAHGHLEPGIQANAHFYMVMANIKMGKHKANNDLNIARKFLEELDTNNLPPESRLKNSLCVAARCVDMSTLYEIVADFETAIYFARRVLAIPELPLKLLVDGSAHLALLLIQSGKAEQGISYLELENMMNKLENFGPQHSNLGNAYEKLGRAYVYSKADLAVKYVEYAKSIMDGSLGPEHLKSLKITEALALTYAKIGRFCLAVEIQEKVVEALRGVGPSVQLDEAVGILDLLVSNKAGFEFMLASSPGFGVSDLVSILDDIVESGMLGDTDESSVGEL